MRASNSFYSLDSYLVCIVQCMPKMFTLPCFPTCKFCLIHRTPQTSTGTSLHAVIIKYFSVYNCGIFDGTKPEEQSQPQSFTVTQPLSSSIPIHFPLQCSLYSCRSRLHPWPQFFIKRIEIVSCAVILDVSYSVKKKNIQQLKCQTNKGIMTVLNKFSLEFNEIHQVHAN